MSLETTRKTIGDVLELLYKGEWQIPQFQREFIWTQQQVINLIHSIIKTYPIGLITIWAQPQGKPYTPGEKIKLKEGTSYGDYKEDPALIKLILDGKQRLTSLAMVFGGLRAKNDRYQFSGKWFINIDAIFSEDQESKLIIYKKINEVERQGLDTRTVCIAQALIPLEEFKDFGEYLSDINNPSIYKNSVLPPEEIRQKRIKALQYLIKIFSEFQIPIAELPSRISLSDVCEIFDVLNTTGTKVSTFDLMHNQLFSDSDGIFLLRDKFREYSELNSLGLLCQDNRQEFLCQLITGCYILDENPKSRDGKENIKSIKGGDLLATPLHFYEEFDNNIQKIDSYVSDLFRNILYGDFKLNEIPYPVSIIIYISLRWHLENRLETHQYSTQDLDKLFRVFFWRNALSGRYDQGFLTQFSADLKKLNQLLIDNIELSGTEEWNKNINIGLDKLFSSEYKPRTKEEIIDILKDSDIRGALKQALTLVLNSKVRYDFLTGNELNRFSEEKGKKVQLHHIFPKDWCKNNKGKFKILDQLSPNIFSNLIPLTAKSNNIWKTNSPSTAIKNHQIDFNLRIQKFESAFIDHDCFEYLKNDDVEKFWNRRAELMAGYIYKLQFA